MLKLYLGSLIPHPSPCHFLAVVSHLGTTTGVIVQAGGYENELHSTILAVIAKGALHLRGVTRTVQCNALCVNVIPEILVIFCTRGLSYNYSLCTGITPETRGAITCSATRSLSRWE